MRYAEFGSISSGTLRTGDLLSAFADELDYQLGRQATRFPRRNLRKLVNEARRADDDMRDAPEIVSELQDALQQFAPPYAYFGAHPGDGADFGYWLGRIFRIMARPEQLDDVADYQRCRAIIMDAAPNPEPDYQPRERYTSHTRPQSLCFGWEA